MHYRKYVILAMLISICHYCNAQWDGRPWGEQSEKTWYELNAEYQPFVQLFRALQERVDLVRVYLNTNQPPLELVQTWVVDAGVEIDFVTNETIRATGFPSDFPNGDYVYDGSGRWERGEAVIKSYMSGYGTFAHWLDELFGDPRYISDTLASSSWEATYLGQGDPSDATTVLLPMGEIINPVTTNIVTTNALGPFIYQYTDDLGTHSATGWPHLTYEAMGFIDTTILNIYANFVRTEALTNGWYSDVSIRLDDISIHWESLGDVGEVAGVGLVQSNAWKFTRQPEVQMNWLLAEWFWDGSNWVQTVSADFDETAAHDSSGFVRAWFPLNAQKPVIELHSTNASASVTVALQGTHRAEPWGGLAIPTNETVTAGTVSSAYWWHSITDYTISDGSSTGDYVTVMYESPLTLYGNRPYRLYMSDFDERAAIIDELRWTELYPQTGYGGSEWGYIIDTVGSTGTTEYVEVNAEDTDYWGATWPTNNVFIFRDYIDSMSSIIHNYQVPSAEWQLRYRIPDTDNIFDITSRRTKNRLKYRTAADVNIWAAATNAPTSVGGTVIVEGWGDTDTSVIDDDAFLDDGYLTNIVDTLSHMYGYRVIDWDSNWYSAIGDTNIHHSAWIGWENTTPANPVNVWIGAVPSGHQAITNWIELPHIVNTNNNSLEYWAGEPMEGTWRAYWEVIHTRTIGRWDAVPSNQGGLRYRKD